MTDYVDPTVTVRLQRQGRDIHPIEYSIDSDFLVSTDGFRFTVAHSDRALLRGLELEPIEILVNGASQLLGRIEITDREDGNTVVCSGRDYIADLVENGCDPTLTFNKPIKLADFVVECLKTSGIDRVVTDRDFALRDVRTGKRVGAPPLLEFESQKAQDIKPEGGEGTYEFVNRTLARFAVTLQPATARNAVCLQKPNYVQRSLYGLHVSDDDRVRGANNVRRARARRDYSSLPTFTMFTGQTLVPGKSREPADATFRTIDLSVAPEVSRILADTIHHDRIKPSDTNSDANKLYRLLYFRDRESRSPEQLRLAMMRAFSERFRETLVYTCTVRGHADPMTGTLYAVDTIASVKDEIRDVDEPQMWIQSRRFYGSASDGALTDLVMIRAGSLII